MSIWKRNNIINNPETTVACVGLNSPGCSLFFSEISTGAEPSISITANRVKVTVSISLMDILVASNMVRIFAKVGGGVMINF